MNSLSRTFQILSVAVLVLVPTAQALAAPAPQWFPKSFSAQVVQPSPFEPGKKLVSKLYVGTAALRLEQGSNQGGRAYIYDVRRNVTWTLVMGAKAYREMRGASPAVVTFLPRRNPCETDQFRASRCRKTGTAQVNGRQVEAWEIRTKVGNRELVARQWVDPELRVWVRHVDYEGTTVDVVNIRTGPQPASLFQLPAGFRPAK